MFLSIKHGMRALASAVQCPSQSMFKSFVSIVLLQFAVLSFLSITAPAQVAALPMLDSMVKSSAFWWGLTSLFGGLALLFEKHITGCRIAKASGYAAAILSFITLGVDCVLRRPPAHAGVIFTFTSTLYLGRLFYEQLRARVQP